LQGRSGFSGEERYQGCFIQLTSDPELVSPLILANCSVGTGTKDPINGAWIKPGSLKMLLDLLQLVPAKGSGIVEPCRGSLIKELIPHPIRGIIERQPGCGIAPYGNEAEPDSNDQSCDV
jgi:hypothetical protein